MDQLLILAGGFGTRLKEILKDLPKPMIPIAGKPLLEHHIELAKKHGFEDVIILAGYKGDLIKDYFGDGSRWGIRIRTVIESQPMGTAGAMLACFDLLEDDFILVNGDALLNGNFRKIIEARRANDADAVLMVRPNDHPLDSELVVTDEQSWIQKFLTRPHPEDKWIQNLANEGIFAIKKASVSPWAKRTTPMDLCKELFPAMIQRRARLLAYLSLEYTQDIGTPERYEKACDEYANGTIQRSGSDTPRRAIFLDRDGTLIKEVNGLTSPEQLELLPYVPQAIRALHHYGYLAVLATNQAVVAKGRCSESDIKTIHNKLETLLGREHAYLDRIYYCPHHPDKGFEGERKDLKIECECRKPKTGMIEQAARELNINLNESWLVGDTTTDIQTAENAGLRSVLVSTGQAGKDNKFDAKANYKAVDLLDAIRLIIRQNMETQAPKLGSLVGNGRPPSGFILDKMAKVAQKKPLPKVHGTLK